MSDLITDAADRNAARAVCRRAKAVAQESSPLRGYLSILLSAGPFRGQARDLLAKLNQLAPLNVQKQRSWPKNDNVLSTQLRRIAPSLRSEGWTIEFDDKARPKQIILEKGGESIDACDARDEDASERGQIPVDPPAAIDEVATDHDDPVDDPSQADAGSTEDDPRTNEAPSQASQASIDSEIWIDELSESYELSFDPEDPFGEAKEGPATNS